MAKPTTLKFVIVALMVSVMVGMILLVSIVLDDHFGHAIAVASFAATTAIIFLNTCNRASRPLIK